MTNILKRTFAPKFLDSQEARSEAKLPVDGSVRLKYLQEPGYFLVPGFPTQLQVGLRKIDGSFEPKINLGYRELTEREVLVGPLHEAGKYEMRAVFYICAKPGEAVCVRRILAMPISVGKTDASYVEGPLEIDLEVILKEGLANAPAAKPVPFQNK
ncbi:MAG: hypothetical protein AB7K68_04625 [Bacteriovoracia bacterium]